MESCPSWSKEHDWKSCKSLKRLRGFESLALRHKYERYHPISLIFFCTKEQWIRKPVKKTVRWTVFRAWDSADINLTNKPYQAGHSKNYTINYPCSPHFNNSALGNYYTPKGFVNSINQVLFLLSGGYHGRMRRRKF